MIKEHQMIKWREQNERVNKTVDDALNKLLKLTENQIHAVPRTHANVSHMITRELLLFYHHFVCSPHFVFFSLFFFLLLLFPFAIWLLHHCADSSLFCCLTGTCAYVLNASNSYFHPFSHCVSFFLTACVRACASVPSIFIVESYTIIIAVVIIICWILLLLMRVDEFAISFTQKCFCPKILLLGICDRKKKKKKYRKRRRNFFGISSASERVLLNIRLLLFEMS